MTTIRTSLSRLMQRGALAAACLAVSPQVLADNPVNGAALYNSHCASCHGNAPLTSNSKKIYNGRNARAVIDASISNVGDMRNLRTPFPAGGTALADLAAYLGNAPTTLGFAPTAVGATSAVANVTIYASLKSGASIAGLTVATSGDFARSGGTCGTAVATGTSCTVGVVFRPTAAGTRSGTLSLTHGNTLTPMTIALSGSASGGTTSAPVAAVSPASLAFATTAIGATSAAQNVTLFNSGNAALSLSSASYGSADFFTAGGTCAFPGSVAAGASCTLAVGFRPTAGAAGTRSAALSLTHNAAGSPGSVSLSGSAAAAASPSAALTASLAFGNVGVGSTSSTQTATLSNSGSAALAISSIATGSSEFSVAGGTCAAGTSLAAGSSCTIGVRFTPAASGARSGTLSVAHNAAGGSSTTSLSGSGSAAAPSIGVSPAALSFSQTVGSTSAAQTVTVSNSGTAALSLNSLTLVGAQAAEFQIAGGGSCAAGSSVAANASCTVRLTFTPAASGARTATLAIAHNAGTSPTNVALNGSGTSAPQPTVSLDASTLAFGAQTVGSTSAVRSVTLTNSGAAALTLSGLTTTGAAAGDFTRGGTCAATTSLAAGATCTLAFTFTPGAIGSRTATLTIASNASNGNAVLSLSGSGAALATPGVALAPAALDFGSQAVGTTSVARSATLSNSGSGALAIGSITASSGFALTHDCGSSVAAGLSCTLSVTFTPATTGSASGTVSIASNAAGSPHVLALAGSGVTAAPVLAWSPAVAALDFGSATVGAAGSTRALALANQGPGTVTLQQLTLSGAQSGDYAFAAGSNCAAGAVLAQGANCTLVLGFQPGAAGARNASLQVSSSGSNPPDVALTGTGSATSQAQVAVAPNALNFVASAGSDPAPQDLLLQSSGNAVLRVDAIRVAAGSFEIGTSASQPCQAPPFDLLPGQTCSVAVAWSNAAAASESGAIEVDSNATTSALSVPLAATRESAAAAPVMSNAGAGGCSISGRNGPADPMLWLLVVLALLVLRRRSR